MIDYESQDVVGYNRDKNGPYIGQDPVLQAAPANDSPYYDGDGALNISSDYDGGEDIVAPGVVDTTTVPSAMDRSTMTMVDVTTD